MVDHRHIRLTAGDLGAAVEDEGGGEVDGGQGRLGRVTILMERLSTKRSLGCVSPHHVLSKFEISTGCHPEMQLIYACPHAFPKCSLTFERKKS